MSKSEDLSKNDQNVWNIQNIKRNKKQIEDEVTDHKYHTHSNGQFHSFYFYHPIICLVLFHSFGVHTGL